MRRLLVGMVSSALLLTACGGGDAEPKVNVGADAPFQPPTVSSSQLGVEPKMVSSTAPPKSSQLTVLTAGTGRAVGAGDIVVSDYKAQVWEPSGAELPAFYNTFATGVPDMTAVDKVIPAWTNLLPGVKVGSRVLLIATPQDAFGPKPPPGQPILPNDTLMFVIDVLDALPRTALATGQAKGQPGAGLPRVGAGADPKITIPDAKPPADLVARVLLPGSGERVAERAWVAVHYTAVVWRTGKIFDSTWNRAAGPTPLLSRMALRGGTLRDRPVGGVIEGVLAGLVGKAVGSRVLIVVPPELGYGAGGLAEKNVEGSDTLVFVLDILGSYRSGEAPTSAPAG